MSDAHVEFSDVGPSDENPALKFSVPFLLLFHGEVVFVCLGTFYLLFLLVVIGTESPLFYE